MRHILFLLAFISFTTLFAQEGETYYVQGHTLNLRSEANSQSEIVEKLHQYDNLKVIETQGDWVKVFHGETVGYVFAEYIKEGKAIVTSYQVRTGAVCKDGSSSSATGRGACSHHGGVSYWKTRTEKSARIE